MRWERLFADLSAQLDQEERYERDLEVADRIRRERAQVSLLDRIAATLEPIQVTLISGRRLEGLVRDTGADWLTMHSHGRHWLIPVAALARVDGLGSHVAGRDGVARRAGLGQVLRALSRSRVPVQVEDRTGGSLTGTVETVGADHLDLAVHPADLPGRTSEVQRAVTVPVTALAVLSSPRAP